ncbi:MAG TPA: ATP-dependent Clp protease proteolytic subunit [Aldersonia sp.]
MNAHLGDTIPPTPPWQPWPPEFPTPPKYPETPDRPAPYPAPRRSEPTRQWVDRSEWPGWLYDRLLAQRVVMAHGWLDDESATRLSAQMLTLDADGTQPIRLELQSLAAELPAALTLMGVLDVVRAPVSAYAGGRISGPALGVLAAAGHRYAYPSALFQLSEPQLRLDGTVTTVASQQERASLMLDDLLARLSTVTGRAVDRIRSDFAQQRLLTVDQAIDYGLIQGRAEPRRPARPGLQPGGA